MGRRDFDETPCTDPPPESSDDDEGQDGSMAANRAPMRPRSLPRNLKKISKRQRDAICPKTVSMRQISCVFVDVCAGDHSVAHYALRADANSVVVSFDVIPKHEALRTVPKHLHHRIAYVELDVIGLTVDRLAAEVQKAWHTGLDKVRYLHFSPDCRTLSTATAGGPTVYRMEDGTPNSAHASP